RVELASGKLIAELVQTTALRFGDRGPRAARRLVALFGGGTHFFGSRHAPLLTLHRFDRVRLEPTFHARAQTFAAERAPPLAIERVGHQHVLETAERALAVDRLNQLVAELALFDGRDEALHPPVLLARAHGLDAQVGGVVHHPLMHLRVGDAIDDADDFAGL